MPKFSFPIPGRKTIKTKDERHTSSSSSSSRPAPALVNTPNSASLSKAQRFFGTDNDLNIDSPTRDDDSWMISSSRSSVMSISISESTYSTRTTDDTGSLNGSQSRKWETENGVPAISEVPSLNGKASSTILGVRYAEDGSVTNTSARLRSEDSSSTLKSFYDRHNSPLAISQQTSASSSRDLALRKGLPKVVPTSPLLHVESIDSLESMVTRSNGTETDKRMSSKKKPAKLDLSMLFPTPGRFVMKSSDPDPSLTSLRSGTEKSEKSGRRRLMKALSKESMRSQATTRSAIVRGSTSQMEAKQPGHDVFFKSPTPRVPSDLIPDSLVPKRRSTLATSHIKQPVSGRSVDSRRHRLEYKSTEPQITSPVVLTRLAPPRPWEMSSAASVSSNNTKGSKKTNNSNFSNTDLQQNSVLSLSSDSESDDSDLDALFTPVTPSEDKAARILNGSSSGFHGSSRPTSRQSITSNKEAYESRKRTAQIDQFPSIPETTIPNPRLSGPWASPREGFTDSRDLQDLPQCSSVRQSRSEQNFPGHHLPLPRDSRYSLNQPREPRTPSDKRLSRKASTNSQRSFQPTPPLSPSSIEFRAISEDNNRFMAVTKQEEALLAALRQKRAMMRERIIEEHETSWRPPLRPADENKSSFYNENGSPRNAGRDSHLPSKQTVLMFLESPISDAQRIYTAEPSPDLSDFIGFGSDEETTPRTSWVNSRNTGAPRPDSTIGLSKLDRTQTTSGTGTPNSAARLSAVGVSGGFGVKEKEREKEKDRSGRTQSVRKKTSSVRFKTDLVGAGEDEEDGIIWGL